MKITSSPLSYQRESVCLTCIIYFTISNLKTKSSCLDLSFDHKNDGTMVTEL